MPTRIQIDPNVTVGAQPSEAEISILAKEGFKTVISLRHEGEPMQHVTPEQEGQWVRQYGMRYIHLPVEMSQAEPELVDRFRQEFSQAPKPVFVHCRLGKRAGAMVMMDQGVRQGLSGQEVLDRAEQIGFECGEQSLRTFVRRYVDSHQVPTR